MAKCQDSVPVWSIEGRRVICKIKLAVPAERLIDADDEIRPKRRRNKTEWAKTKTKRLRAEGKEYINITGDKISARKTGDKCRYEIALQSAVDRWKYYLL